jgi:hypothetical protein
MKTVEIKFQEHNFDDVLRYFAEGFKPKPGEKIVKYEYTVDGFTRKVIFKLYVEKNEQTQP